MVNSGTLFPGNGVPLDDNTSGRTEVRPRSFIGCSESGSSPTY